MTNIGTDSYCSVPDWLDHWSLRQPDFVIYSFRDLGRPEGFSRIVSSRNVRVLWPIVAPLRAKLGRPCSAVAPAWN